MRGKLVVFEGLDRAGKSTQCERLVQHLSSTGHQVKHMRFPDRLTPIGKMIDSYLKGDADQEDHVIHLLFSANRWEAAASIRKAISEGTTVVIDRYSYSGAVYSAAKDNPSLSLDWARHMEAGLPRPDICVFLSISPQDAAKRGGFGSEKYETTTMQKRVKELFETLRQGRDAEDFVVVDGGKELNEVEEQVREVVLRRFEEADASGEELKSFVDW